MANKLLEMNHITMDFPGVRALDNVDFSINAGEVHALIGENGAGKSTLMKILLGLYQPTSGEIILDGKAVTIHSPIEGLALGISMIHQEISLVGSMTVEENIWLGREKMFAPHGLLDFRRRRQATNKLLERLGMQIDPGAVVRSLSTANMQFVEIARAVSYDSKIIIMDEPTSALADREVEMLMRIIRDLSNHGVASIFISHKLDELLQVCDRYTVLRDGKLVGVGETAETNKDSLIQLLSGRKIENLYPKETAKIGKCVLKIDHLTKEGVFKDISFELHEGEVLGLCGLLGAGRTEILECIFGITPFDSGEITVEGSKVSIKSPKQAIALGMGMITEDRLRRGIIHKLSVRINLTISYIGHLCRGLLINKRTENDACQKKIDELGIRLSSIDQLVSSLSGGNQQKVVISRSLMTNPRILLMDEPTRGIDVGAKSEIYKLINQLTKEGMAIVMVSSELPEVMGMSDRIAVISRGVITSTVNREDFNTEQLMAAAYKGYESN